MKKAVAYTRVSTKSDAQIHSYSYQNEYWGKVIKANPEYEFLGIYADQGISGKSIAKRPQFLEMMKDAREKRFEVIFTKSVARFGRNVEELLTMVRELRELGIRVVFEKENIDSFDPTAEIYLTVAAAVAENDLRTCSENQKWAIRKKFASGFISIGNKILGYRMNKETNTLEIVPSEAETIRLIFKLYLSGLGIAVVAKKMTELKQPNWQGMVKWDKGSIRYILSNEKYMGCSLTQKTVTDFGECKVNKNKAKQYYTENTHEPIIAKEVFEEAQRMLYERTTKSLIGKEKPTYPFSGLITCGQCGKSYVHKINNAGKAWETAIWICRTLAADGKTKCDNKSIKDEVLRAKFIECFNEFVEKNYQGIDTQQMQKQLSALIAEEQELTGLKVNKLIEISAYNEEVKVIRTQIAEKRAEIEKLRAKAPSKKDYTVITEFDEEKVNKFIDKVTMHKGVVTFIFMNGVSLSRPYTNGPSGNQVGWQDKKLKKEEAKANGNTQ